LNARQDFSQDGNPAAGIAAHAYFKPRGTHKSLKNPMNLA